MVAHLPRSGLRRRGLALAVLAFVLGAGVIVFQRAAPDRDDSTPAATSETTSTAPGLRAHPPAAERPTPDAVTGGAGEGVEEELEGERLPGTGWSSGDEPRWEDRVTVHVVADDTGRPVEGATVRALLSWKPETFRAEVTDATGRAELTIPDRGLVLWVRALGFLVQAQEWDQPGGYRPGRDDPLLPEDLHVEVRLIRGPALRGRVVRADTGAGIGSAQVYVWNRVTKEEVETDPLAYGTLRDGGLTADAEGRFEVAGTPMGVPLTIAARAEGLGIRVLELEADAPRDVLLLTLDEGAVLQGAVTVDGVQAPTGVRVYAVPAGACAVGHYAELHYLAEDSVVLYAFGTTDGAGRYRITGLPTPARYAVVGLGADSSAGVSEPVALASPDESATRDVAVVTPADIRVRGLAPDGSPCAIQDLQVVHRDGGAITDIFAVSGSYVDGRGSLYNLSPGAWLLLARAADEALQPARLPIELVPGGRAEVEVRFERGLALHGVLRDDAGDTVVRADIATGHRATRRHVRTDDDGRFMVEGLDVGHHTFSVRSSPWYEATTVEARLPRSEPLVVIVRRRPVVTARVEVLPGIGPNLYGRVLTPGREEAIYIDVAPNGTLRVPHVPIDMACDLRLWWREGGLPILLRGVRGDASRPVDLGLLRFQPGRAVSGLVVDERGEPLVGVKVVPDPNVARGAAVSDTAGRFTLDSAPDAVFTALVQAPGRPLVRGALPKEGVARIVCPQGHLVRGALVASSPGLAADLPLRFVRESAPSRDPAYADAARTDAMGAFKVALTPGLYAVHLLEPGEEDAGLRLNRTLDRLGAHVGLIEVSSAVNGITFELPR